MSAFADALEEHQLTRASASSAIQSVLGISQARLRAYREAASAAPDTAQLILALRSAAAAMLVALDGQPRIELAWTYPGDNRANLRTTGGVAREIVAAAKHTILVVGYAVTVDSQLASLASQTVSALARAAERGVTVTVVLHRGADRNAITQAWRAGVPRPKVYTWPANENDDFSSIHAKLLVADRCDALVTSANLTRHGFERNLEMGVRIVGTPASEIHDSIHTLIATGELIPWV